MEHRSPYFIVDTTEARPVFRPAAPSQPSDRRQIQCVRGVFAGSRETSWRVDKRRTTPALRRSHRALHDEAGELKFVSRLQLVGGVRVQLFQSPRTPQHLLGGIVEGRSKGRHKETKAGSSSSSINQGYLNKDTVSLRVGFGLPFRTVWVLLFRLKHHQQAPNLTSNPTIS